jgi:hypothetical protein
MVVSISVGVPTGSIGGWMPTVTCRPLPKVTTQGMIMLPVAWARRTGPAGSLILLSKNGMLIDGVGVGSSTKRTTMPLASRTPRSWLAIRNGDWSTGIMRTPALAKVSMNQSIKAPERNGRKSRATTASSPAKPRSRNQSLAIKPRLGYGPV